MKILINLCLLILSISFFAGCTPKYTIQGDYNKEYLSYNLITKAERVNSVNVLIKDSNPKSFFTGPDAFLKGTAFEVKINKDFNKDIAKEFMSQYFNNVSFSDTKSDIVLDTSILTFKFVFEGGMRITTKMSAKLHYKNKIILNKLYDVEYTSPNIYASWTMETLTKARREQLLKSYLDIYEKYIKDDLVKALEENL